jgi:hypothetical protein
VKKEKLRRAKRQPQPRRSADFKDWQLEHASQAQKTKSQVMLRPVFE